MKRITALLLTLAIVTLAGCGGNTSPSGKKDKNRSKTLKISYFAGGYGDDWWKAVADDFMEIDKDTYIELNPSYDNVSAQADIQSGNPACDLYQIEIGMFSNADYLLDISDVYEKKAYGEDKVVKDKLDDGVYEFYNESGKYYQFPATSQTGWNWVYNKTVLDELYGEGNYTIPRTTDEFFRFGDSLFKDKKTFLTVSALGDPQGGDYLKYAFETWFAQMTGKEGYENYQNGNYYDKASGQYKFSESAPLCVSENKNAIEKAYEVAYKLSTKSNHYIYSDSNSLNFKGADQVFYGGGYGMNKTKTAFLYTGAWLETEVKDIIEDGIAKEQEVIAIKMPVISAITDRCSTISNDDMLCKVIDYVDGKGEKPAGVSDADVAIVKEARNIICENCCRSFVVPKNTKNAETVKEFLAYLASDRAQKISAQNANGLSRLPFGYIPTEDDMGFKFSPYVKSIYDKLSDSVVLDVSKLDKPFSGIANLYWVYDKGTSGGEVDKTIFSGKATEPSKIYESTYSHFNSVQWETFVKNYNIVKGK